MQWFSFCLVVILAGCSSSIYLGVTVDKNANFGAPVQVDIVFISNDELERQIMTLSAQEWFTNRAQVQRDYPEESTIKIASYEFVPGQYFPPQKVTGNGAKMAIVFINIGRSAATNRARVPVGSTVHLRLGETDYRLEVEE